jgi:hypothetical protein
MYTILYPELNARLAEPRVPSRGRDRTRSLEDPCVRSSAPAGVVQQALQTAEHPGTVPLPCSQRARVSGAVIPSTTAKAAAATSETVPG